MSHIPHHDPAFTEAISKNMQVPERLSVSPAPQWPEDDSSSLRAPEELLPAFTMQVPDKLTFSETSDMSPRPLFTPPRQALCSPSSLDPCWESLSADVLHKDLPQSPIKRSYSDQSFSRTPPGTPTHVKQMLQRHPAMLTVENWSTEEDGGTAVELIVLRRQLIKISRRLAALERNNHERRNTEVLLFSLLFSACLLNVWLWIRR
ncbi:mitochondrial fission factor-like isoform X3 [Synchiropus splendidus]|uniref:mitochondrial fission factor-like isoform X3 n=1 Tax=Synchiropus splendidus TaxID=270530 RepID=UPI00237D5C40|nr:mitochondrial fission factor-like isoform X3 [Synchiropus splendidus]